MTRHGLPKRLVAYSEEGRNKAGQYIHSICTSGPEEHLHECVAEVYGRTAAQAEARAEAIVARWNAEGEKA